MSVFTAIDISKLPAPDVVEEISFEQIFAEMLADLKARDDSFSAMTESDPAYKILQVAAYREVLIRQRVNEAGRAVMLPYASGADLDNLGALLSVPRLLIDEGDPDAVPPVPPTYESDADFRRRIQLSPEGFSTAGPEGAYIFHALSADGEVLDASATSSAPDDIKQIVYDVLASHSASAQLVADMEDALNNATWPGDVNINVLSRVGDGSANQALVDKVDSTLTAESVRPLTDNVAIQSASIVNYTVDATLYFYSGPGNQEVLEQAQAAIEKYTEESHRLGIDITLSGIYAALHQPGVQRVDLVSPASDIAISKSEAAYCTAIDLGNGGVDE